MATVQEIGQQRTGRWDENGLGYYTRRFRVTFDSKRYSAIAARAAVPILRGAKYEVGNPGDPLAIPPVDPSEDYESDAGSFARTFEAVCDTRDALGWIVTVNYEPGELAADEDPLAQPADYEWEFGPSEEIVDRDINGDAIVNSAGDPFDPPVTRERSTPILKIAYNAATFDAATARAMADRISSGTFLTTPAGCAKITRIRARRATHDKASTLDKRYWQIELEIHFSASADGFKKVILDMGTHQRISGNRRPITNAGVPVTQPVPLDGSGAPASLGAEAWLEFDVYQTADFNWIESLLA